MDFIEEHVNRGKKVYIHCNAGVGRSAVITVAYLVHQNSWTLRQAYTYVKEKRTVVSIPNSYWSLRPHWRRLLKWYARLQVMRGVASEVEKELAREPEGEDHQIRDVE